MSYVEGDGDVVHLGANIPVGIFVVYFGIWRLFFGACGRYPSVYLRS
jgi:hypothetical protein